MGTPVGTPRSVRTIAALLVATVVYALPAGLVLGGVWLIWSRTSVWLGVVVLAAALGLMWRPRVRRDTTVSAVDLASAPQSADVLDAIAAAVDAPTPRRLCLSRGFGAEVFHGRRGWTITIGAPLWLGLGPDERVALLAQALAPFGNEPGWSERYVGGALTTLDRVIAVLSPDASGDPHTVYDPIIVAGSPQTLVGRAGNRLLLDIVTVLLWPLRFLASLYRRLLAGAAARMIDLHQERIDRAVATVAGADAVTRLHRDLVHAEAIATLAQRAANTGEDMQMAVRQRTARLPMDPESGLGPGRIRISLGRWETIDAEWANALDEQFALLRRDYR